MNKEKRKELMDSYKKRTITGGVYCIQCSGNHRTWLRSTTDIEGVRNRTLFSLKMKGAPEPAMMRECSEFGHESFSFVALEELQKKENQTDQEFAADVQTLYALWLEKYEHGNIEKEDENGTDHQD